MHVEAFQAVADFLQEAEPPKSVVEFGSRFINGSVRPLFRGASYVGVDIAPGPCVDVVADAATFKPALRPACVVCCEVLEHAENAKAIVANAVDILEDGGSVIVTCASTGRAPHSAVDGGQVQVGEFYRNVPPETLLAWLEEAGAERVKVLFDQGRGDAYAVGFKP